MGVVNQDLITKIEGALDTIRPYLEADGGNISLVEVTEDMIVKVRLIGTCSSCDVSMMTLKNGVEVAIRRVLPDLKELKEI